MLRNFIPAVSIVPLLLTYACATHAIAPGHRVRVVAFEGDTVVGSVLSVDADSLHLSAGKVVGISTGAVQSLEVDLRSVRPWLRPVECGLAAGAGAVTVLGASDEGWSAGVIVQGLLAGLYGWECADGRPEWRAGRLPDEGRSIPPRRP